MNILITNIGRRGYLVDFLKQTKNFKGNIYVSDCNDTASGLYTDNDGFFILPKPVDNPQKYIESLVSLCKEKNIDIVIPVIDPEISILSKNKELFERNGIFVMVACKDTIDICYDKVKMNEFLKKNDFDTVKYWRSINEFKLDRNAKFPVFIKPIYGSGSLKSYKIDTLNQLEAFFESNMIIQEFIDGIEYGIDIFNDSNNENKRIVIKKKIAMRSGETDKSITIKSESIKSYIEKFTKNIKHVGPMDIDVIASNGKIYIIDLNPRLGGGYPATHLAGVNFLELIIKLSKKENIVREYDTYKNNLIVMKDIGLRWSEYK